jgi:hypothetical protein
VTVKEPRTGVVGHKSEGDVVQSGTDVDDVATNGVDVVVLAATGTSDHIEYMLKNLSKGNPRIFKIIYGTHSV